MHQVRNTLKYTIHKDRHENVSDMRKIYSSPNMDTALLAFDEFENK